MITRTIDSYRIQSQSNKLKKKLPKVHILEFCKNIYMSNTCSSVIWCINMKWIQQVLFKREREIKFIGLFEDRGHRGPYSPYKPFNHNLYIGIIIFPHIDNPQSTGYNYPKKKPIKIINEVLFKIQNRNHSVHRQTDGQSETSIPPSQLCWSGGIKMMLYIQVYACKIRKCGQNILGYQSGISAIAFKYVVWQICST